MYEELIQGLRDKAEFLRKANRDSSIHNSFAETMSQAADAIEVISKTEKTTRWIPVTERLPEKPYGCLAVVWDNTRYGDGDMFLNYYPEFIGWDGETWNDADGEEIPFDVVYWMKMPKIPEPPEQKEEAC